MKKLLILLFFSISFLGYAQHFQLTDLRGNPYENGDIISATITENDLIEIGDEKEFIVEVIVENLQDFEFEISTKRTNINLIPGMQAYVCFGVCDDTREQLVMDYLISEAGTLDFSLHLVPNGNFGLCQFQIDFMTTDTTITLFIDIDLQSLAVKEQNKEKVSLSAYPNPVQAGSNVNLSYTLAPQSNNVKLVVRNILGAEVMSIPLNPQEKNITVNTASLVQGVYFYAIENNHHILIAKKLIVK